MSYNLKLSIANDSNATNIYDIGLNASILQTEPEIVSSIIHLIETRAIIWYPNELEITHERLDFNFSNNRIFIDINVDTNDFDDLRNIFYYVTSDWFHSELLEAIVTDLNENIWNAIETSQTNKNANDYKQHITIEIETLNISAFYINSNEATIDYFGFNNSEWTIIHNITATNDWTQTSSSKNAVIFGLTLSKVLIFGSLSIILLICCLVSFVYIFDKTKSKWIDKNEKENSLSAKKCRKIATKTNNTQSPSISIVCHEYDTLSPSRNQSSQTQQKSSLYLHSPQIPTSPVSRSYSHSL